MNFSIAEELKTGPRTEEGKAISRLNAIKTGRYSKLLNELTCNICKRKSFCQFYKENSFCTIRGEISKSILVENLDSISELTELYRIALSKGIEASLFDSTESVKWFNLATKHLELIDKMINRPEPEYD